MIKVKWNDLYYGCVLICRLNCVMDGDQDKVLCVSQSEDNFSLNTNVPPISGNEYLHRVQYVDHLYVQCLGHVIVIGEGGGFSVSHSSKSNNLINLSMFTHH